MYSNELKAGDVFCIRGGVFHRDRRHVPVGLYLGGGLILNRDGSVQKLTLNIAVDVVCKGDS